MGVHSDAAVIAKTSWGFPAQHGSALPFSWLKSHGPGSGLGSLWFVLPPNQLENLSSILRTRRRLLVGQGGKIRRYRSHDTLKNSHISCLCSCHKQKSGIGKRQKVMFAELLFYYQESRWGGGCGGLSDGVSTVCLCARPRRSQFLREMLQFSPTRPTPVRLHILQKEELVCTRRISCIC